MLARAHSFALILALAFAIAAPAAAAPEMFAASFIWHAWSNDISSGTADPYLDNYFAAVPRGWDCRTTEPYTTSGAKNPHYCTPNLVMFGHPATGQTATPGGWGGKMAPARSIGSGTPPRITLQQSDFTIALYTATWRTTWPWGQENCCRGFLPNSYPAYLQTFTYATFVNAAGSFFANGGAVAAGYAKNLGGSGTGRYNNRTGMAAKDKGTWRIQAGANAFGGAMGLLGKYGATGRYTNPNFPGSIFTGVSSWPMVHPLGRLFKNTVYSYGGGGKTYWFNPYSKTDKWYYYGGTSTISAIGTGTLWTTGQVGNFNKTGAYETSLWRTGFDNRTLGGKGSIQLVTPTLTHWSSPGFSTRSAQTGLLRIRVPESGAVLLFAVGVAVLVVLHRVSRRG
jgi:hypothetical protein